jgi:hypothetical protein
MEKSKYFNKRIKRDVDKLIEIYPNYKLNTDEISNFITLEIFENNDELIPIYKFVIKQFYPFRPPDVYYKNLSYENIYKVSSQRVQKYLTLLTNKDCLCCTSILCSNNWYVTLNFFDIIKEINNNAWLGTSLINDENKNTDEVIKLDRISGSGNISYRRNKEDGKPMYKFSQRRYVFECKKIQRKF